MSANTTPAGNPFSFTSGGNPSIQIEERLNTLASFVRNQALLKATSDLITIPVSTGTTNTEVLINGNTFIPANSVISSIGILFIDLLDGGANAVFKVGFGSSSGTDNIVDYTTLLDDANSDISANQFVSTSNGNKGGNGGTAMIIQSGSVVYAESSPQSLFLSTITTGNVLGSTCKIKVIAEYIPYTTVI